jgi:autotransporter translocation and assembly factor TamB
VGDVDVLKVTVLPIGTSDSGLLGLATATGGASAAPALASAPPPPAGTPLALDIHVTAPPMTFIDTKTARVDGRADLRVNGTFDRPSITGAVDIIGGELLAFGNRYIVREGSILFNDPDKFQPVFDLAAETRPRIAGDTFDINIRITGTLDGHLKVTPTSDPSLPDSEIVTLLVGGTPDTGQAQQSQIESPQELQQRMLQTVGAVLLTAPISSRVGEVVEKTLPVDTVQITPLLQTDASVQQLNPSARITFAKRISGRVTLTYSRTVSGIQDELILLEYDQNDRISWVLSRNEDRTLALDFRIRYVF